MRVFALVMMIVAPTLSHAMEVVVSAEVQTPPRPTIHGSSNLPDGTKLAVIVTRQESAYRAEALTEVKSGRFVIGPLSQRGNDLNPVDLGRCCNDRLNAPSLVFSGTTHFGQDPRSPGSHLAFSSSRQTDVEAHPG